MNCKSCICSSTHIECNCLELKRVKYKENGVWRITTKKFKNISCFKDWIKYAGIIRYIDEYYLEEGEVC
jgi:hypothetical protein